MPHSYTNLLYHLVFATKERRPWMTIALSERIYSYMGRVIEDRDGLPLAINGADDHVHMLLKLSTRCALADVIRDVKANSSRWMRRTFDETAAFEWQAGYGAFTVSESQLPRVRSYIRNQRAHHRTRSFQDEYRQLLAAHRIAFDERDL